MDSPQFTDADLSRITLSSQLQELSESFRLAVAAEDDDRELAGQLCSLLTTEIPQLTDAIVGYTLAHGGSWDQIAQLTGLPEQDARERWDRPYKYAGPDPAKQAQTLDHWYIRHAQLESLARVRDPFSRLMSGRSPGGRDCLICGKYEGRPVPAWAGYPRPPGGHLIDDGTWRVGHGPTPYWPAGTLLIESRRHFLDYAEFQPEEAETLGPMIRRLTGPLKAATGAPRIHLFSCMEGTEHFHLWLVPRTGEASSGRGFIADPGYCTAPQAEEVIGQVRRALEHTAAQP